MPTCETCEQRPSVGVAAIPYIPMSAAYCRECVRANAHPWWALVANTACIAVPGVDWRLGADPGWIQMVDDTIVHLGRTAAEFDADVAKALAEVGP